MQYDYCKSRNCSANIILLKKCNMIIAKVEIAALQPHQSRSKSALSYNKVLVSLFRLINLRH